MKHLKAKLMATVMSLTLSLLMLTSASFAWFTISTAPEVRDMTTNVAANKNLEIALSDGTGGLPAASGTSDAGQNTKWGNLVDLKGYFSAANIQLKPVLASFTNASSPTFSYPQFGYDGRISGTTSLTPVSIGSTAGSANFNDMGGVYVWTDNANNTTGASVWAYEVDYWLRTNVSGGALSLTDALARGDAESELGLGSWISNDKITVKFVVYPTTVSGSTVTLGTPTVFNGDKTAVQGNPNKFSLMLNDGSNSSYAMTANQPYLVKMYVFFDGNTNMTNESFTGIGTTCTLNVQFRNDAVTAGEAMQVTENGYASTTANGGSGDPSLSTPNNSGSQTNNSEPENP